MDLFKIWTDKALIKAINGTPTERERALKYFFDNKSLKKSIENHIIKYGGTNQDFDDVWQDTLIIFDKNIRNGKFLGESKLTTYFFGIAKIHWLKTLGKKRETVEFELKDFGNDKNEPPYEEYDPELKIQLEPILSQIGEKCKALFLGYAEYSYEELATQGTLGNADAIRKDMYRCRQRLYKLFDAKPELRTFLKSLIY